MSGEYPIMIICPEWKTNPEQMGSKEKFWFHHLGEPKIGELKKPEWLFKFPQPDTGQHWAEKIAAEVAQCIRISHARVELAMLDGRHGSATLSFVRDDQDLLHGNQILAGTIQNYNSEAKSRHPSHTLGNVWQALDGIYKKREAANQAKQDIAEYIILDALIGNTDRHHENWGILVTPVNDGWQRFIAPSFDHASSLGRELLDERRERLLTDERVGDYAEKGRGALYWSEDEGHHGPSPLELVRRATHDYPDIFHSALNKLQMLDERSIWGIIDGVPDDWMTSLAKQFSHQLMLYNLNELRRLI